ncbi:MAG: hypothetical protein M1816_001294 [Peltula sp. TS41687]|nr:MAG: hypothetical protein M1816_001294 [Peltula sp. TS41687]
MGNPIEHMGIGGDLHEALLHIRANAYPTIPNPTGCKRRASVALIIRVRAHPSCRPAPSSQDPPEEQVVENDDLTPFFAQPWVQHSDPEVLFIKRAARANDRWTSHVALPGGKRDAEDEDDKATAVRETWEEVGLDLKAESSQYIGKLPERVVTTEWGLVPLMVLCPFVFLYIGHELPALRLQGTEVGSAHWVSLRALLTPSLRTFERCDISDRLAKRGNNVIRIIFRAMLGQMLFSAVRLVPSESIYDSFGPGFLPQTSELGGRSKPQPRRLPLRQRHSTTDRPLLLWGLTLGIIADFIDLLPSRSAVQLWTYPTFSPPDVRFIIWAMTYSFRKRKLQMMTKGNISADGRSVADEEGSNTVSSFNGEVRQQQKQQRRGSRSSTVGVLLDGYYDLLRKAMVLAMLARVVFGSSVLLSLWRWYRRRRQRITRR